MNIRHTGKKYNGEKAVISFTSWTKRIKDCDFFVYNLLKQGPNYHYVITLSTNEFPNELNSLPTNLAKFINNNIIEALWINVNIKSFKKVLPACVSYRDIPVISADDDCLYSCNYADILYNHWLEHRKSIITNDGMPVDHFGIQWGRGPNTLYPPCFNKLINLDILLPHLYTLTKLNINEDDSFYGCIAQKNNISVIDLKKPSFYSFYNAHDGLSDNITCDYCTSLQIYHHILDSIY